MDHRLGERVNLWAPAVLHTAEGRLIEAHVLDISLSGLGLIMTAPKDVALKPLQRVSLAFEPLGAASGTVVLNAYVARIDGDHVGLMFETFQEELMRQIRRSVAGLPAKEDAPLHPAREQPVPALPEFRPEAPVKPSVTPRGAGNPITRWWAGR